MSNVDFKEIADGVAHGSESRASTPEAKKLIRALIKAEPGEVSPGELRDFVRALVEGKPEHASYAFRDLVKAVITGKVSSAPYNQRDLATALVRRYGTENRSRGLSGGLDRDALAALEDALRSRSERDIDWPELRALAVALLHLDPYKAPSNGWRGFVEALRKRDPDAAASPLDQIARAAILRDPGRAPSGWPRSLAELLIRNRIPEPMTVVSAESDSDLKNMAHALENGNPYAVSNQGLRGIVEAVQKRDPRRAPDKFRGFVEALLKGDPSRAPKGEMQEIAKAVVKKRPGDLPFGPLRDLATALVEALEPPPAPPAAVGSARSASAGTKDRGKASAPSGRKDLPGAGGVLAALLSNDPQKASPGIARLIAAGLLSQEAEGHEGAVHAAGARRTEVNLSNDGPVTEPAGEDAGGEAELGADPPPTFRNLYLRELDLLVADYSQAQLERVETYRLASDVSFMSVRRRIIRCYFGALESVGRARATPARVAEVLVGVESRLGIPAEIAVILRGSAIDAISTAKVSDEVTPEAHAAFVEELRRLLTVSSGDAVSAPTPSEAPKGPAGEAPEPASAPAPVPSGRLRSAEDMDPSEASPPPAPAIVPPPPGRMPPTVPSPAKPPGRGLVAAFVKAAIWVFLGLGTVIGVSQWLSSDRPGSKEPTSIPTESAANGSASSTSGGSASPRVASSSSDAPTEPRSEMAVSQVEPSAESQSGIAPAPEGAAAAGRTEMGEEALDGPSESAHPAREAPASTEPAGPAGLTPARAPAEKESRPRSPADIAWWNGDWDTVYKLDLAAAQTGDAEAQVRLGRLFYDGLGRRADPRVAEDWYRKAAANGSAEAKYRLGLLYSDNRPDAPWDLNVARQFFIEAAGTHALSALKLGYSYAKGVGVTEDHEEAKRWFQKAASLGNEEAAAWLRSHR